MFDHCTHYKRKPDSGGVFVFQIGNCPECGGTVQEANGISVYPSDMAAFAEANRLARWDRPLPAELDVLEDGTVCCEACATQANDDLRARKVDQHTALPVQRPLEGPKPASANLEEALSLLHKAERLLEEDAEAQPTRQRVDEVSDPMTAATREALRALMLVAGMEEVSAEPQSEEEIRILGARRFHVKLDPNAKAQITMAIAGLKAQGVTL